MKKCLLKNWEGLRSMQKNPGFVTWLPKARQMHFFLSGSFFLTCLKIILRILLFSKW